MPAPVADTPAPPPSRDPSGPERQAHAPAWLWPLTLGALASLLAASLAALLVAWLPLAGWSGPLAAALVAGPGVGLVVARWLAVQGAATLPGGATGRAERVPSSLHDTASGLLKREPFLLMAGRDMARSARYGGQVGMLVVEVDRLRALTDRAGPAVADALLAGLGRDIQKSLRGADLATRYGDAQLACFLPEADATGALDVADRIRERVERLTLPGLPPTTQLTASIGVALLRPGGQSLATLQADAEAALALARQAGGNCVRMPLADRRRAMPRDETERRKGE